MDFKAPTGAEVTQVTTPSYGVTATCCPGRAREELLEDDSSLLQLLTAFFPLHLTRSAREKLRNRAIKILKTNVRFLGRYKQNY